MKCYWSSARSVFPASVCPSNQFNYEQLFGLCCEEILENGKKEHTSGRYFATDSWFGRNH